MASTDGHKFPNGGNDAGSRTRLFDLPNEVSLTPFRKVKGVKLDVLTIVRSWSMFWNASKPYLYCNVERSVIDFRI